MAEIATSVGHVPPAPIQARRGGKLRFAVGAPEGLRSSTWSVQGGRTARDVYVSSRAYFGTAKLSLHASGIWRFAHTESFAAAVGIKGDRLIQRMQPPQPVARGWRRAATIVVPHSSLRSPFREPVARGAEISWWPATVAGWTINFEIMVSDPEPDFDADTTWDCIGEVGRIPLVGGGGVFVLADEKRFAPWEPSLNELREQVRRQTFEAGITGDDAAALAWGTSDDDGRAMFFDLGDPGLRDGP